MIKIGIIGGGASGLLASIIASMNGAKVTVFEAKEKFGMKLSVTGNGKCNVTNTRIDPVQEYYYAKDHGFVETVLQTFGPDSLLDLFHQWGIETVKRRDGYIYPRSNSAKAFASALLALASANKVTLKTNCPITKIKKNQRGYILYSGDWSVDCDRVIIACGSDAGMKKNTELDNHNLIRTLKHTVYQDFPALTGLKFQDRSMEILAKIRLDAKAVLYIESERIRSDYGEIQFNKDTISGIPIFQLSHPAVIALGEGKKVRIDLDIYPDESLESLCLRYTDEIKRVKGISLEQFFITKIPRALILYICDMLDLRADMKVCKMERRLLEKICSLLKGLRIGIKDHNPMTAAQVAQGGVSVTEINPLTMGSNLSEDLYFCGEIIDVDGYCGGYNLQWAWSTAYIAARHASKE